MKRDGNAERIDAGAPAASDAAEEIGPSDAAGDEGHELLELVLAEHEGRETPPPAAARIEGVVVGQIAAFTDDGTPHVRFAECPGDEPLPARAMVALAPDALGREVALLFEAGDPARPVVMGLMHRPVAAASFTVEADGERVQVRAAEQIVLSCGAASLTLTRAGKIILKGTYVVSRSTGVNRIVGGSVQIN